METKIVLYDHQRLYLDCMTYFLNHNNLTKKIKVEVFNNFEDIEGSIINNNTLLIINSIGVSCTEVNTQIEKFLQLNPASKIIIHSTNTEVRNIKKFFDKGVKGYLGNNTDGAEFSEAIKQVMDGNIFVNYDVKNELLNSICGVENENEKKSGVFEDITAREKDVLLLICDGLRSREIAEKLFISSHTVDSHRRNMMLKFNVNSSAKLVKFALENKLIVY